MRMAYRLRNRQMQIPNGYTYKQPETHWKPTRYCSFNSLVAQVCAHRMASPELKAKYPTMPEAVAEEMDEYNAAICARFGWVNYIDQQGGAPPPKSPALAAEDQKQAGVAAGRVVKIWSGVRTLDDWLDSGEPAVAAELSEKRASRCAVCPLNGQGDFTKWFTKPAAEAIRRQLSKVSERNLKTSHDEKLIVCEACLCPLKLKVHTPFKFIKSHISPGVVEDLKKAPNCWILEEMK